MKQFSELILGKIDASEYLKISNKDYFNRLFIIDETLSRLTDQNVYFIVGDKGTGKTAYAVYISNKKYNGLYGFHTMINNTDYTNFIHIKKDKKLDYTDYENIWSVLIYLLLTQKIINDEDKSIIWPKEFKTLRSIRDEFYENSFQPDTVSAFKFITNLKKVYSLGTKYGGFTSEDGGSIEYNEEHISIHILNVKRQFEKSFSKLKLKKKHVLFIDGIDIRPKNVEFSDFLHCIQGLFDAVYNINVHFFSKIKDSEQIRIVLLLRPDIFNVLDVHNRNAKLRDNSVVLNWVCKNSNYRNSSLFELSNKLLEAEQDSSLDSQCIWDYYFQDRHNIGTSSNDSFIYFLEHSMHRPRDIITMLQIMRDINRKKKGAFEKIMASDFDDYDFKGRCSDYLLSEIKDFFPFEYSNNDYEIFLKFFSYLNGSSSFSYQQFIQAYNKLKLYVSANQMIQPTFLSDGEIFLQFLYDLNVIGYYELIKDNKYWRWCYRERDYSNMSPKVEIGLEHYHVHKGLTKALRIGYSGYSIY